jgi:hypothetical protein
VILSMVVMPVWFSKEQYPLGRKVEIPGRMQGASSPQPHERRESRIRAIRFPHASQSKTDPPKFFTSKGSAARQDKTMHQTLTETADWILFSGENAGDVEKLVALI